MVVIVVMVLVFLLKHYYILEYSIHNIPYACYHLIVHFTYNTSSDIRLKENITNLNNGIDIIKQLRPVEFTWRSDNKRDFGIN